MNVSRWIPVIARCAKHTVAIQILTICVALWFGAFWPTERVRAAEAVPSQTIIMLADLEQRARDAEFAPQRAARLEAATTGRELAGECVRLNPREPGCYYFRAVLTGLYHQLHVIGYQRGIKQMVEDCLHLIRLDPTYGNAGAYRILAQIYSQIPQTAARPGDLIRDLPRATTLIAQAVALAPHYIENHLVQCEVQLANAAWTEAAAACRAAEAQLAQQRDRPEYAAWQQSLRAAKKRLARRLPTE